MRPTRWFVLAALALLPTLAAAAAFTVEIDTTPLAGRSGFIAVDLLGGSVGAVNDVQLASFASTATLGAATTAGDVSGSLAGTLTLRSSVFFNELLQAVVFNAGLTSFSLTLSENSMPGGSPDTFSFFLLDTNLAPFATSDPAGALFLIDLRSPVLPQTFTSVWATAAVVPVPEPPQAALLLLGLLALAAQKMRKASHR